MSGRIGRCRRNRRLAGRGQHVAREHLRVADGVVGAGDLVGVGELAGERAKFVPRPMTWH